MVAVITQKDNIADEVVAIDLGSNSFHLLLAKRINGGLQPITTLGYKVQLGLGLSENKLCDKAIRRALDCLQEFAPYTQGRDPNTVRIVGTHALRSARDRKSFIDAAQQLLGQPIDIISAKEEATLVYRGVDAIEELSNKRTDAVNSNSKMVVDIGGGSTELVVGQGAQIEQAISVPVGCVSYLDYFPSGSITEQAVINAYNAACTHFTVVAKQFTGLWQESIGCSGTLLAVEQVLSSNSCETKGGISRTALQGLRSTLLTFETIASVTFKGLSESRRSVFASGLAIVLALFDSFSMETMRLSRIGLREGVAWQLLQRNSRVYPEPII